MPMASPLIARCIGTRTAKDVGAMATDSMSNPGWPSGYASFAFMSVEVGAHAEVLARTGEQHCVELVVGDDAP